jgi:hypothetical protein
LRRCFFMAQRERNMWLGAVCGGIRMRWGEAVRDPLSPNLSAPHGTTTDTAPLLIFFQE